MISIALAKNVQTKGRDKVSNSPLKAYNTKNNITERKKRIQ